MLSSEKRTRGKTTEELLTDLLIVQLAIAGVSQQDIRKIAGCRLNRVTKIARLLVPKTKQIKKEH